MDEKQPLRDKNLDFYDNDVAKKFELTNEMMNEAQRIIDLDKDTMSVFWKEKYINECVKNWDKFYKRNSINFFSDRHWIEKEFKELLLCEKHGGMSILLIEFGCGVGNSLLPLLKISDSLHCIGLDCSARAINFLEERWNKLLSDCNEGDKGTLGTCTCCNDPALCCPFDHMFTLYDEDNPEKMGHIWEDTNIRARTERCNRLRAFVFDIVKGEIPNYICYPNTADFGLLIFVLSAIHPRNHKDVIIRCSKTLRSGAVVLFRDYGRYDLAQLRFAKSGKSKITDNFYVRNDGTFAYYFTTDEVRALFENAGFKEISNCYCLREITNRKTNVSMKRVWIQSKFIKI